MNTLPTVDVPEGISTVPFARNIPESVIYLLGARGVGKTSLINILLGREFRENETHTKKGIKSHHYQTEKNNFLIKELTDDENFSMTKNLQNSLEELMLILVMFSIDDEKSLDYAENIILFIKNNLTYNLGLNIILIGNKMDKIKSKDTQITVNKMEAENFALDNDISDYYISCQTKSNVEKINKLLEESNEVKYIDKEEDIHEDSVVLGSTQPSGSCEII